VSLGDLRDLDLTAATIIVLYLLPESIEIIKSNLIECLQRGNFKSCGHRYIVATKECLK
jgi:hypothetical protein